MKKKNKFTESAQWKISHITMHKIPQVVLALMNIGLAVVLGILTKHQSSVYKEIGDGMNDNIMRSIILLNIAIPAVSILYRYILKAFKLNVCDSWYLKIFQKALKSKISDITEVGVGSIMNTTSEIAGLKSGQAATILATLQALIPFAIVVWEIFKLSPATAIAMVVIMVFCIVGYLNGNKLLKCDTVKAELKGHMHQVTVSNFEAVKMLKYMGADDYAMSTQEEVQYECAPACNNPAQNLYEGFFNFLINVPCVLALYVAFANNDTSLALFIAFNEWTINNMVGLITDYVANQSEIDGCNEVINKLKGDDVEYQEKPVMPERLVLKNIGFHYASDTEIKNPYLIPELEIKRGKRYRIEAASGVGKSTLFKFFAGEMEGSTPPDVRVFYIHQKTELLYDTLRNNITLGNKYVPDTVIEQLLDDIGMGDWLRALPDGLDTIILGEGVHPSGGEASRISLMRLFIHIRNYQKGVVNPVRNTSDIIMLDEVTSALDKRTRWLRDDEYCTEEKVIDVIDRETRGCTMLVISHEDESSKALGFRHIVDYSVHMHVEKGDNSVLRHIVDAPIPNTDKRTATNITVSTVDVPLKLSSSNK